MADISHDDGLAAPDPDDLDADRYELILQAQALTHLLESLIESSDDQGHEPNDPRGLRQQQYACIRSLRMHLAEVEALSNAITEAGRSGSKRN